MHDRLTMNRTPSTSEGDCSEPDGDGRLRLKRPTKINHDFESDE